MSKLTKSSSSVIKPLSGFRRYLLDKIRLLINRYERLMLTNFPSTYRMLQMFTVGTKEFSYDVFEYMRISKDLAIDKSVQDLTYKELMIYMKTPKDIRKMTPFLLITALPLAQYVSIPLAFTFPKQLLSSHYWTIQQRTKFSIDDHRRKLYHYRPLFRSLQKRLDSIESPYLRGKCRYVFTRLGSGTHPNVDDIIHLKPLFIEQPFGLRSLSQQHLVHLCRTHGLRRLFLFKRRSLFQHITFIQAMDSHLFDSDLSFEQLRQACFLRGLNPINLTQQEMFDWLQQWQQISKNVDDHTISLLLHTPLFLAYNHPSNWRLIYSL
uniref:LETM1 domain-containing protein 1-like n=1 Tax=Dermatophagoides pteronyssinus TaxID=6956 RepID=A0A6P6YDI0_DERPT|nr:LETM1 domain-containing protein 1-like [Dermatophagoides pteronyssinus]